MPGARTKGFNRHRRRLQLLQQAIAGSPLDRALVAGGLLVEAQTQRNVTGGVMGIRVDSGRLRSSIRTSLVRRTGRARGGAVSVGTRVVYARILHDGGRTAPHVIRPRRKKALAFTTADGTKVVVKQVNHPGSRFPERPYLSRALKTTRRRVLTAIRQRGYYGPLSRRLPAGGP